MKTALALVLLLAVLAVSASTKNILVVIADDFGIDSHSLYNTNSAATPAGSLTGRAARLAQYKLIRWDTGAEEFYDLAADSIEATNLLTRPLADAPQASLDQLRARLAAWTNTPKIHAEALTGGAFIADAGWFVNADFTLWRTADFASVNWVHVTSAAVQDCGDTIRLTDPQPSGGKAFYRVRHE